LRAYLLELKETGHNPGGRHAKYRAVRRFLNWYQAEAEPEGWKNPMAKVKPPKATRELIEGVNVKDIRALLSTCNDGFIGARDKAILLCLLDTGARAMEFLSLNIDDVDTIGGAVLIRMGKGRKSRVVFIGRTARRALRAYLKQRTDSEAIPAVWVTSKGERLAIRGLQSMLLRRARLAGVATPSPHDFRRAFALLMLRAGTDVITLARLMGHASLEVLTRYLKQTTEDLQRAHEKASPADKL
jgi:site-specific recombinase XerD